MNFLFFKGSLPFGPGLHLSGTQLHSTCGTCGTCGTCTSRLRRKSKLEAAEAPLIAPSAPIAPAPLLEPDSSDEDLEARWLRVPY